MDSEGGCCEGELLLFFVMTALDDFRFDTALTGVLVGVESAVGGDGGGGIRVDSLSGVLVFLFAFRTGNG